MSTIVYRLVHDQRSASIPFPSAPLLKLGLYWTHTLLSIVFHQIQSLSMWPCQYLAGKGRGQWDRSVRRSNFIDWLNTILEYFVHNRAPSGTPDRHIIKKGWLQMWHTLSTSSWKRSLRERRSLLKKFEISNVELN